MSFRTLSLPSPAFSLQLLGELTACAGLAGLRQHVEATARAMTLADTVRLYAFQSEGNLLRHGGGDHAAVDLSIEHDALLWTRAAQLCLPLVDETEATFSLALPVTHQGALVGVLGVEHSRMPLHAGLLELLVELVTTAGAVWNLVDEREQTQTLVTRLRDVLLATAEHLEPARQGRAARMRQLAMALGEKLDLSKRTLQTVWDALGYLDLGRLALAGQPEAHLDAFGPQRGAEILRSSRWMNALAALVEYQDQRYDEGPRKSVEAWVVGLCTDIERARTAAGSAPLDTWFERFLTERGIYHHHSVIEALQALHQGGRLEALLHVG